MTKINNAVIVEAVRSPMGTNATGGWLRIVHPTDLLAQALSALVSRTGMDAAEVGAIITACAAPRAKNFPTVGQSAWNAAELSQHPPATAIEASRASEQAMHIAAQGLKAGNYQVAIAAGLHSLCHVGTPTRSTDPPGTQRFSCDHQEATSHVIAAEATARSLGITRREMDAYAARSIYRAAAVARAGEFDREITPIRVQHPSGTRLIVCDETLPGNDEPSESRGGPEGDGPERHVTPGNSAQPADCVSALLMMSDRHAQLLNLSPRARFCSFASVDNGPEFAHTSAIRATYLALARAGLLAGQLDHVEVDETFAAIPLAWQDAVGTHSGFLNPRGGAIALGHAGPASGIRMLTTMLTALEDTGGRYGLAVNSQAGGGATAVIIERP